MKSNPNIEENGVRRLVWLPIELDSTIEEVRQRLGMSKSAFYRYAITRLLQEMSILSTKAKEVPNNGE
jgi:hypothetical protein